MAAVLNRCTESFKLSDRTRILLENIERRICPEVEDDFQRQWHDFLYDRFEGEIFQPVRMAGSAPSDDICRIREESSRININDAIEDYDLMLQSQLVGISWALDPREENPNFGQSGNLCLRANYGTGILSSLFGAELFMMPREMNTLPTTRAFNDTERVREMVANGQPDIMTGLGKKVFEFGEICAEVLRQYPKISKYVSVYHPDVQGPIDICELLWGGEMFYAMYDEPDLVHSALELITQTYAAFMEKWQKMFPPDQEMNAHWGNLYHRGSILIRNDSGMNLSPELYEEFSIPYDGQLLEQFGGGAVHFCGRGDHYIEALCKLPGMYAINMSQPEYNDMEKIYQNTVGKGIKILAFNKERALQDCARPGGFKHNLSV